MTQTLELNKMGLTPMSEFEMQEINGGGFWTWLGGSMMVVGMILGNIPLILAGAIIVTISEAT